MSVREGDRRQLSAIIVGAGLMGRHHASAAAAAGASIVGIVDRDRSAASLLAARWPGATAATDLATIIASMPAGVAHICTPAASHRAIGAIVANAGLHALIEKPLGTTAAEAELIHGDFAGQGKLVCPTHQYAFQRSVDRACDAWASQPPRRIMFDICSAGGAKDGADLDRIVAEILPHPLSMLQRFLPSADLASIDFSCRRSMPGEWVITTDIDGVLIVIQMSMNGRPTRFTTRITGEQGSMELDNFHDYAVAWPGRVSRTRKITQPFMLHGMGFGAATANLLKRAARRELAYPGLRTLVGKFHAAVRDPAVPPPITPRQSIAVAQARDKIVALASHG